MLDRRGFSKATESLSLQDAIFGVAMTLLALTFGSRKTSHTRNSTSTSSSSFPAVMVYGADIHHHWRRLVELPLQFRGMVPQLDIPGASLLLLGCADSGCCCRSRTRRPLRPRSSRADERVRVYIEHSAGRHHLHRIRRIRLPPPDTEHGRWWIPPQSEKVLWLDVALGVLANVFWSRPKVMLLWQVTGFVATYIVLVVFQDRFVRASIGAESPRGVAPADEGA